MRPRKQILQKLNQFYDEMKNKRKKRNMRLQVENESQQVKTKDLNDKYNVEVFSTSVRGGKAFVTEQKKELKSRVAKLKTKVPPTTIILQSPENMNNVQSKKYGITPNKIELKSLPSEKFKTLFEKVLILAERIKKLAPGKFYKQTVQNIPYFNKKNDVYNKK